MKIFVRVKTRAKEERVEKIDETHFNIFVKQQPQDGKANEAVIKVLSKYFKVPQSQIKILSGQSSKQKIIEMGGLTFFG